MATTKTAVDAKPTVVPTAETPATEPRKDIMGIERDDNNARVSFTPDGNLLIVTIPIGHMAPATAHGFLYLLHDTVRQWYKERKEAIDQRKVLTGKVVSAFNFKQGLSKIFHK